MTRTQMLRIAQRYEGNGFIVLADNLRSAFDACADEDKETSASWLFQHLFGYGYKGGQSLSTIMQSLGKEKALLKGEEENDLSEADVAALPEVIQESVEEAALDAVQEEMGLDDREVEEVRETLHEVEKNKEIEVKGSDAPLSLQEVHEEFEQSQQREAVLEMTQEHAKTLPLAAQIHGLFEQLDDGQKRELADGLFQAVTEETRERVDKLTLSDKIIRITRLASELKKDDSAHLLRKLHDHVNAFIETQIQAEQRSQEHMKRGVDAFFKSTGAEAISSMVRHDVAEKVASGVRTAARKSFEFANNGFARMFRRKQKGVSAERNVEREIQESDVIDSDTLEKMAEETPFVRLN